MIRAILFYGVTQTSEDEETNIDHWAEVCKKLEDIEPPDSGECVMMLKLLPKGYAIAIDASVQGSDMFEDNLIDVSEMLGRKTSEWDKMITDFCTEWGIQISDQRASWYVGLQEP